MSGECDVCGQYGHVEIEHCAFKDLVDELQSSLAAAEERVREFQEENDKYRVLCGFAITDKCYCQSCTFGRMVDKLNQQAAEIRRLKERIEYLEIHRDPTEGDHSDIYRKPFFNL